MRLLIRPSAEGLKVTALADAVDRKLLVASLTDLGGRVLRFPDTPG